MSRRVRFRKLRSLDPDRGPDPEQQIRSDPYHIRITDKMNRSTFLTTSDLDPDLKKVLHSIRTNKTTIVEFRSGQSLLKFPTFPVVSHKKRSMLTVRKISCLFICCMPKSTWPARQKNNSRYNRCEAPENCEIMTL
uniref:Uncharacterized protein n=1 Tax=Romanomermis culicivorax TaxID=13658 RepID=A0A915K4N6_ROMCU